MSQRKKKNPAGPATIPHNNKPQETGEHVTRRVGVTIPLSS